MRVASRLRTLLRRVVFPTRRTRIAPTGDQTVLQHALRQQIDEAQIRNSSLPPVP
ncbi:MAG TPA: hypothetical protein VFK32_10135 [Tepidiformaceae bacterium]|nr:hypothetical protein [Tepidiformaceae bacterium]